MPFVIPESKKTPEARYAYCVAAQEKLRRLHNARVKQLGFKEARQWIKGSFIPYSTSLMARLDKERRLVAKALENEARALVVKDNMVLPTKWEERVTLLEAKRFLLSVDTIPDKVSEERHKAKSSPSVEALAEVKLPTLATNAKFEDPYEDFTTYTELDPHSRFSVTSTKITITNLKQNEDIHAWVYDDKGSGHFGSFDHLFEAEWIAVSYDPQFYHWCVSNDLDAPNTWWTNYDEAMGIAIRPAGNKVELVSHENHGYDYKWGKPAAGTWWYYEVVRSGTSLTAYLRSGSHTGSLIDTLVVALPSSSKTYRYVFGANANNNDVHTYSGATQNLDLQETSGYELECSQGAFTLTGQSAGLEAGRKLDTSQGAFSLVGNNASLQVGRKLATGQGAFALGGQSLDLLLSRLLAATNGSYLLGGYDSLLLAGRRLESSEGVFALGGQDALLQAARKLASANGAFTIAGNGASLLASRLLELQQGSLSLTGQEAALIARRLLESSKGDFTLAGQETLLARLFSVAHGAYELTGQEANLVVSLALFLREASQVYVDGAVAGQTNLSGAKEAQANLNGAVAAQTR